MSVANQGTATQIAWVVSTTNKKHQKPVIFTLDGHQRYQLMMADAMSASFYHLIPNTPGLQIQYDPYFSNDRNCMKMIMDVLQVDQYIHVGIAHERYQHVNFIKGVGKGLGFPTIYVEHKMPKSGYQLGEMEKKLGDTLVVFRSEEAQEAWGYTEDDNCVVIPDFVGLCRRKREPSSSEWLTIQDHIDSFRSPLWDAVRDERSIREQIELRGWNGCLGYETTEVEEATLFERYRGYVNFDHVDPLPLPLLQAAGYCMPIISVRTPALERLFKDGESIIFVETPGELEAVMAASDPEKDLEPIAMAGQKVIEENFGRKAFRDAWTNLIKTVAYE